VTSGLGGAESFHIRCMDRAIPNSMSLCLNTRKDRGAMFPQLPPGLGALFALAGDMWPNHRLWVLVTELTQAEGERMET